MPKLFNTVSVHELKCWTNICDVIKMWCIMKITYDKQQSTVMVPAISNNIHY